MSITNSILRGTFCFAALTCATVGFCQKLSVAFYYDRDNQLVQIEDLTAKTDFGDRLLQDVSEFRVPRMTTKHNSDVQVPCTTPGATQPMSNNAEYVIYWGSSNIYDALLHPVYLEYVRDVETRNIVCEQINEGAGCPAGTRCLTSCAGAPNNCAAYCCVKY